MNILLLGKTGQVGQSLLKNNSKHKGFSFNRKEINLSLAAEIIEKFVGINKDYNNYELINAISLKNKHKCLEIIFYLSNNPKNHPLILIISSIFQFFKKLLLFHGIDTKDDKRISSLLGVNPYFLSQYSAASKLYSMKDCSNAIDVIYKAVIK